MNSRRIIDFENATIVNRQTSRQTSQGRKMRFLQQKERDIMSKISITGLLVIGLSLAGCSSMKHHNSDEKERIATLESKLSATENQLTAIQRENMALKQQQSGGDGGASAAIGGMDTSAYMLPPNAKPGECYARVLIPPSYTTAEKQIVKSPAAEKIEVIPAEYEWVEERVMVREPGEKLVTQPAVYDWVEEKVVIEPAAERIVTHPPVYDTVTEKILVKPAYTTWKKGRGPIEKVDNATGEIMCLVEVPAEYKTVKKRVLVEPARTETVSIPPKYKTIKKKVMVQPPKVVKKEIPPEYKLVKVKKMVNPPQTRRVPVPAEYETVVERQKVSDARMEWRPILCETNTTPQVVQDIQRALKAAGYNPGPVDGALGSATMQALKEFQRDKHIAEGQITLETLQALGISR